MPQPHEQKLHEVVNSLTSESFKVRAAASTAGQSRRPPTASPAPPPIVNFNASLRLRRTSRGALMRVSPDGNGFCGGGTCLYRLRAMWQVMPACDKCRRSKRLGGPVRAG